jgi:hypothetical protein
VNAERLKLFADGSKVIPLNTAYFKKLVWKGLEALRGNFEFNVGDYAKWEFKNPAIRLCLEPNYFAVLKGTLR